MKWGGGALIGKATRYDDNSSVGVGKHTAIIISNTLTTVNLIMIQGLKN